MTWESYIEATRGLPPRPLLVRAVAMIDVPGEALDLGSGAGNDARFLLDVGYRVTAVDSDPAAIDSLPAGEPRLQAVQSSFAAFDFPLDRYVLISAQLSLPFSRPEGFDSLFARLTAALVPGGVFTGQLFGVRDAWNQPGSTMAFHTAEQVRDLLRGMDILELRELEDEVMLASGDAHHAHWFDIIVRRPAPMT